MLADPTAVRDALGFDDMTDINEAIRSALATATVTISSRIGTSFDRNTVTDTYYVYESSWQQGSLNLTEFRLTQGFVSGAVVGTSSSLADGSDAQAMAGLTLMAELGVVKDFQTRFDQKFVRLTYTAGFEADTTDPEMYDLTQVPAWLQDTAKLQALLILSKHPTLTQADVEIDARTISTQLNTILSRHTRYTPVALLPI